MSSLYFTEIAPSATDSLSNAQNAFITSGASVSIFFNFARFSLLYIMLIKIFRIQSWEARVQGWFPRGDWSFSPTANVCKSAVCNKTPFAKNYFDGNVQNAPTRSSYL